MSNSKTKIDTRSLQPITVQYFFCFENINTHNDVKQFNVRFNNLCWLESV